MATTNRIRTLLWLYGIATLRRKHLMIDGDTVILEYIGT